MSIENLIMAVIGDKGNRADRLVVLGGEGGPGRGAGQVWLVGAGPGDPELLTIKALKVLQTAQVVVHDGLVSDEILDLAPASARKISVAKRKSRHSYSQDEINRMLVAFALEGLNVVRLKGGDPFIFGRGGEELEACREAGVSCHIIPGVTAALAAGAGAGAPLTHRGSAQAVTFVTGHAAKGGEPDLDWESLSKPNQTVVVYMGVSMATPIAARLIEAGRVGSTPALIVENASRTDERRIITTLAGLPEAAAAITGPALLIVGEAMALAEAVPFPQGGRGGPSAEEPMVERASLKRSGTDSRQGAQQTELRAPEMGPSLSTTRSSAGGPPLPLRGKGRS